MSPAHIMKMCYWQNILSPKTGILSMPTHVKMSLTDYCFGTMIFQMPEKL